MIDVNATLSDHILLAVLSLLKREVSEHSRHLTQYFSMFLMYSSLGLPEVKLLSFIIIFVICSLYIVVYPTYPTVVDRFDRMLLKKKL